MDPKSSPPMILAPGASSGASAWRLPADEDVPAVDDYIDPPEVTRYERIDGRRVVAMPANPEHADPHFLLDHVVAAHLADDYVGSTDLKTRVSRDYEYASDTCVRREGLDENGKRHLEELVFEVVNERSDADTAKRAREFAKRGVRRQIAVFVKTGEVCEWSTASQTWRRLDPRRTIKDPCLAHPLEVRALLDAGRAEIAAALAMEAKGNPAIVAMKAKSHQDGQEAGRQEGMEAGRQEGMEAGRQEGMEAGRQEGLEAGRQEGRQEGLAEAILSVLSSRGVPVDEASEARIRACRDDATLKRWLARAVTSDDAAGVLGEG